MRFLLANLRYNPAVRALERACAEAFARRGFRREAVMEFHDSVDGIFVEFRPTCPNPDRIATVGMLFALDGPSGRISARTAWWDGHHSVVGKIVEPCPRQEELDALLLGPADAALSGEAALVDWIGRALDMVHAPESRSLLDEPGFARP